MKMKVKKYFFNIFIVLTILLSIVFYTYAEDAKVVDELPADLLDEDSTSNEESADLSDTSSSIKDLDFKISGFMEFYFADIHYKNKEQNLVAYLGPEKPYFHVNNINILF